MANSFVIKYKVVFSFIAISFIWGSTWAVSKLGIEQLPLAVLAYLRNLIAGSIMVTYFFYNGYSFPNIKQLIKFSILSMLLFTINCLLVLYSLEYIPSHIAAVIGCTSPLFIYVIQRIKKRTEINIFFILGCIISIAGIYMLVSSDLPKGSKQYYFLGILLSFIAVLAWSIGFCVMENNKKEENIYYSFAWQLFISGIVLYILSLFSTNTFYFTSISFNGWLIVTYLSIIGSVLAFICLAYTMKFLPPNISSLYVFINPIVAFCISVFFFKITITILELSGIMFSLVGLWVSLSFQKIKTKNSMNTTPIIIEKKTTN